MKVRAQLGAELKRARSASGLSLERASGEARISQGYLHKLEAGRVNNPSPRVLQRLSDVLGVPYRGLMELADYLMPEPVPVPRARPEETEPMAAPPTNAELLRLLEAIRAELAELETGQRRLAQALEQITTRST